MEQEHKQEALPVRMWKHLIGLPLRKKLEAGLYLIILMAALGYVANGIVGLRLARMPLHDETQQYQFDAPLVELDRDQTYLLVAHANWWVTCRDDVPVVERLDDKYAEIGVYTMDVDFDRVYLREEFGVVSPATTILVVDGEIVQMWFGPIDEGEVSHELDELLNQGYSGDSVPFPTPTPEPRGVQT